MEEAYRSQDHAPTVTAVTSGQPLDWVVAADELCAATMAAAPKMLRRVAEDLYEGLLNDVQDYLRDNVAFNLSSELARAKAAETEARDALQRVAEALGSLRMGWPCGPSIAAIADEAVAAVSRLRERDTPDLLDQAWAAVNVLGAPDTACRTAEDLAYCRGIGDALAEIEKLGGRSN